MNGSHHHGNGRHRLRAHLRRTLKLVQVLVWQFRVFIVCSSLAFLLSATLLYYLYPLGELPAHHHSFNDLANLECSLTACELSPGIRIVLRLFDQRLAKKVEKALGVNCAFSASALAAPVFAQAALSTNIPINDLFITANDR